MWWWLPSASAGEDPVVLSRELVQVREQLRAELAPSTCPALLASAYDSLVGLRAERVDRADVAAHAPDLVLGAFGTRVEVQEAIGRFGREGTLTRECVTALRRADMAWRYLADHVLEEVGPLAGDWLVVGPEGPAISGAPPGLRSGDVLVTRATLLSSAGIAHLGGVDSLFSHNALVRIGPDGAASTVEAYLEKGALVQPLETFLASGLGRVVVLRHRDPELAARAAEAAWKRVAEGPFLPYDDTFHHDDGSRLFCSEVPRWAFGELIGLPPSIPWDLTRFPRESNGRFFAAMGIEATETSMPADLLFDPNFSIVGEWRDPAVLPQLRRHDAIAESAYRWMEEEGYEVDPTLADQALVTVGLALRRLPLLSLAVRDRLLPTSSPSFLVTGLAFDEAGRRVDEELVRRLGEGRGVERADWLAALEAMRREDLSLWERAPDEVVFHVRMHPGAAPLEMALRPSEAAGCEVGFALAGSGAITEAWANHLPRCAVFVDDPWPPPARVLRALPPGGATCELQVRSRSGDVEARELGEGCDRSLGRYLRRRAEGWSWPEGGAPEATWRARFVVEP